MSRFSVSDVEGEIGQIALRDPQAGSKVMLAPSRGGMASRFEVGEHALFYLDEASFLDPSRSVRGGAPVLFPTPGKLAGDAWSYGGHSGAMKQHGLGRKAAWSVGERSSEGAASCVLELRSSEATRAQYPWDFEVAYRYVLEGARLRIEQRFSNTGSSPMPFGAGFHPYFFVPQDEKAEVEIETAATRAFDNVAKREGPYEGLDLTQPEVDCFLLDHGSSTSSLTRPGLPGRIVVEGSEAFSHWVVWTLKGRDFVCLEPWTCPGDALNTGERLMVLEPGEQRELWTEIRWEKT